MIITEIYIDGFGIFHEYPVNGLQKGINIIEGENEAGKSTFLNFIRYTLFGYPNKLADRYEPVDSSSGHGGRIVAELSNGKHVIFERHNGVRGGGIQLHYDGVVSTDEGQWSILLGNATYQLFQSIYGFTLQELIGFDNLKQSGIDDKIFSLGMGLTNVSVGDVENQLLGRAEGIYKRGGRGNQDIPRIFKSIEEKKSQILNAQKGFQQYQDAIIKITDIQTEIDQLRKKLSEGATRKELLTNYLKCYDSYISILQTDRELKGLPSEYYCPENADQQLTNLEIDQRSVEHSIELLLFNDSNDGIEQLKKIIDRVEVNESVLSQEVLITKLNEQIEKYQLTLKENEKTQTEINELNEEIAENIKRVNSHWTEEDVINFSDVVAHRDKIERFNKNHNELEQKQLSHLAKKEVKNEEKGIGNKHTVYYLALAIATILSAASFYYSKPFGIAFLVVAILIFVAFLVSKNPKKDNKNDQLTILSDDIATLTNNYNNYLLNELNLSTNLSYNAVVETFNLIENTKRIISKRESCKRTLKERDAYKEEFEVLVKELREKNLVQPDTNTAEELIREAKKELSSAKLNLESKQKSQEVLETKQREIERLQRRLDDIGNKIAELFFVSHALDRNDFLRKYQSELRAKQFLADRKNHVNTIEKIIGFGKVNELFTFLGERERNKVESELLNVESTVHADTTSLLELTNEKGRLETEIDNLKSSAALSALETELEVERNKLMNAYKQWLKMKLALKVLDTVRKKYEVEKQPEVIQFSSEVFSNISSKRYKRIHVPLDSKEVLIYDYQERAKRIEQLSRGTREQLLISLRLGLIREYENNKEPLPIVLDDVFVNFDSCRTKNIADAIQKFAENRQVIIFTCHSSLVNNFSSPVNKIKILPFTLNGDQIPNELLTENPN